MALPKTPKVGMSIVDVRDPHSPALFVRSVDGDVVRFGESVLPFSWSVLRLFDHWVSVEPGRDSESDIRDGDSGPVHPDLLGEA